MTRIVKYSGAITGIFFECYFLASDVTGFLILVLKNSGLVDGLDPCTIMDFGNSFEPRMFGGDPTSLIMAF